MAPDFTLILDFLVSGEDHQPEEKLKWHSNGCCSYVNASTCHVFTTFPPTHVVCFHDQERSENSVEHNSSCHHKNVQYQVWQKEVMVAVFDSGDDKCVQDCAEGNANQGSDYFGGPPLANCQGLQNPKNKNPD